MTTTGVPAQIGDPINEAARLCELAKRRPDRVLASGATLDGHRRRRPRTGSRARPSSVGAQTRRAWPARPGTGIAHGLPRRSGSHSGWNEGYWIGAAW